LAIQSLALLFVAYLTKSFVRLRYTAYLFFILTIFTGWSFNFLEQVKVNKSDVRKMIYALLFLFFVVSHGPYIKLVQATDRWKTEVVGEFNQYLTTSKKIGFLAEHPVFPLVFKLKYLKDSSLVPVNIMYPKIFEEADTIERKHLLLEGDFEKLTIAEAKWLLSKNELDNFFYLLSMKEGGAYYDPERIVLAALDDSCGQVRIKPLDVGNILFFYEECDFR